MGRRAGTRRAVSPLHSRNVLDGQILHELRALAGAMSDTRKSDKSIPALKFVALGSRKRKSVKAKAPIDAAPTGAAKTPTG